MRPFDHLLPNSPDECQSELARILARGLLRLHGHLPMPAEVATPDNPPNSSPDCLDVPAETSVTVHGG